MNDDGSRLKTAGEIGSGYAAGAPAVNAALALDEGAMGRRLEAAEMRGGGADPTDTGSERSRALDALVVAIARLALHRAKAEAASAGARVFSEGGGGTATEAACGGGAERARSDPGAPRGD